MLQVYRTGIISSARRRTVTTTPLIERGVPTTYALPAAPAGTLREIQLPTDGVQIQALFNAAVAGDSFIMPNSTVIFSHEPTLKVAGTATNPISLRGTANSVFESGSNDYGLHIMDASYNMVLGGTFNINKKGIVMDNSKHCVLRYVRVSHTGQEAIHFRASSSDGLAEFCTIEGTGEENANFGEGFYVGTHDGNWTSTYADRSSPTQVEKGVLGNENGVDRSDRVTLQYNQIINTTGEGLDYKQGVYDVVVKSNDFYACGWSGANSADSAIDLKGDNALLEDNDFYPLMPDGQLPTNPDTGLTYIQRSCIQARILTSPYGNNHIVNNNRAHGAWDAYLFEAVSGSTGHTVYDNNVAPGAALGIANVALTSSSGTGGGPVADVKGGTVAWSSSGTVTPTLPSGMASGDMLVACVLLRSIEIPTAPAGWTVRASGVSTSMGAAVYTKVAGTGEVNPQFSTTSGAGYPLGAFVTKITTWSGTPTAAGDFDDVPEEPLCPSINAPTGANVLRLICMGDDLQPDAPLSGLTSLNAYSGMNFGDDAGLGGWYGTQTSAGQTGTIGTTFAGSDPWIAFTVVVPTAP